MPLQEEIGKAYVNYYTHARQNGTTQAGLLKKIVRLVKRGYLANRYGYQMVPTSFPATCFGYLLYFCPIRRRQADVDIRYLAARPRGRLLDVGCGSGEWLLFMRGLDWEVEGVDFDENAVNVARQRGVPVKCGSLEQQAFPDNTFDAVTLFHVIEHVPNPVQTLAECARILKPDGKLVLFTPNSDSLSHRIFKQDWRGLEPPRHLHLFSMQSMRQALIMAGFRKISIDPYIVTSVVYESTLLRWGQSDFTKGSPANWRARSLTQLFKFLELCLLGLYPSVGDCLAAVAIKVPKTGAPATLDRNPGAS